MKSVLFFFIVAEPNSSFCKNRNVCVIVRIAAFDRKICALKIEQNGINSKNYQFPMRIKNELLA